MKDKKESNLFKYPFNGKSEFLIDKIMLIGYDDTFIEKNTPKLQNQQQFTKDRDGSCKTTDSINLFPKQDHDIRRSTCETDKIFINRCTTISYGRSTLESFIFFKDQKKSSLMPTEFQLAEYPIILGEIASDYSKNFLENDIIIQLIFPMLPKITYDPDKNSEIESNVIFSFTPLADKTKNSINGYAYIFYEQHCSFLWPKVLFFYSEYPYFSAFKNLAAKLKQCNTNIQPLEHLLFNIVNFLPSPINYSISLEAFDKTNTSAEDRNKAVLFPQLSCYPLFNFNLSELFNILPIKMIIEIFFFTFLEHDMIFFSRNLELLNITMFIFANLNFPCNDSTYYWQILSVSLSCFLNESISFCNKPCSSIIGIHEGYDSSIQTTAKNKDHFIVDIDNKKIEYKYKEDKSNKDDVSKTKAILEYINKAMKSKSSSSYFKRAIAHLYESLRDVSQKTITSNATSSRMIDIFKHDSAIDAQNKYIQNVFYSFIVKILHLFTESNSISLTALCDKKGKGKGNNTNNDIRGSVSEKMFFLSLDGAKKELKPEEALIDEKFQQCSKYNQYIVNFNQFQDCIDLFKIPLFITQELISWLNIKKDLQLEHQLTFCFELMDKIYYDPRQQIVNIDITEFNNDIVKEELLEKKKDKGETITSVSLKMKRLINYYNHYLNLSEEEKAKCFSSYELIQNNHPRQCTSLSIQEKIELEIIEKELIKNEELILMSIITVFCLTRETCAPGAFFQMGLFKDHFVSNKINLNKYYVLLLNICYRLPKKCPKFLIDNYFLLVNSIRTNDTNVIPNEELLMLLNQADSMIQEISVEAYDFENQLTDYKFTFDILISVNNTDKNASLMSISDDLYIREKNEAKSNSSLPRDKAPELVLIIPFSKSQTINRSEVYSVRKIYSIVNEMLEAYYQTLDNDFSYDIDELKNSVLNLVFYIQITNWKNEEQKRDLTQLMLSILIYVNSKGNLEINKKSPFVLQLK